MSRLLACLSVYALMLSACSTSASAPGPVAASPTADPRQANGSTVTVLADGKVPALPNGTLYMNVIDIPEAPGQTITHAHVPGFVYAVSGTHRMPIDGLETLTLTPGQAGFVGTQSHSHIDPDSTPNDWYFVSIRPIAARAAPPLVPQQKVLFETPDLPALPAGPYTERLAAETLDPGGRGAAHRLGGVELLFVLQGSIRVQVDGKSASVTAGQGSWQTAGTCIQAINDGPAAAKVLTLLVTAEAATSSPQGSCD